MQEPAAGEITSLLGRVSTGDAAARNALLPLIYKQLVAIAQGYLSRGRGSLAPGDLVHELYVRIATAPLAAHDRNHFYAIAALAMRQILADRVRRKRAAKRGGDAEHVTLTGLAVPGTGHDMAMIEDALSRLEALRPRQARIVELHFLVGLSITETADAIGVSERTVYAEWRLARAWLIRALGDGAVSEAR